jgi:hypothetical protein
MSAPRFLVLIPTHAHAELLPFAVRSVQAQTRDDLELVLVGDGVDDATRDVVADLRRGDDRIRFLDRPKSPRTGEAYRHEVLQSTSVPVITYLCDDDMLLPGHLDVVDEALRSVDLVHSMGIRVSPEGGFDLEWSDLGVDSQRERELGGTSLVGLTGMAHTLEAYRRLPHGWRSTPAGRFTDHYMYEQFLGDPACTVSSLFTLTALRFPDSLRRSMSPAERRAELEQWSLRLQDPEGCAGLVDEAMTSMYRSGVGLVELVRAAQAAEARSEELGQQLATLQGALDLTRTEVGAVRAELAAAVDARQVIEATATWRARARLLALLERVRR